MQNRYFLQSDRGSVSGSSIDQISTHSSPRAGRALARKLISIVPFGSALTRAILSLGFRGSSSYWEKRYATGQNSGVGSYGLLAEFKGDFLRRFMRENAVSCVIDFGCGDGNQIGHLEAKPYVGLDVSDTAIEKCRHKYKDDPMKRFISYNPRDRFDDLSIPQADMSMSLDVIFHLVEDDLFEIYIANLFAAASRFVLIYTSNRDEFTESPHVRHRDVTSYIENNAPDWVLHQRVENPHKGESSYSDFFVFKNSGINNA